MDYENQILEFMKNNSDSITIEEINKLNIPRITLTRLVNSVEYIINIIISKKQPA